MDFNLRKNLDQKSRCSMIILEALRKRYFRPISPYLGKHGGLEVIKDNQQKIIYNLGKQRSSFERELWEY